MARSKQKKVGVLVLFAVTVRIIKGKLGFNLNTADDSFLTKSEAVEKAFTDDVAGYFAVAFAGLATLHTQNGILKAAIDDVLQQVPGAVGAKNTAKRNVKATLNLALAYVNALAAANQNNAEAIITAATMQVVKEKVNNKQDFAVVKGSASGEVILRSLAARIDGKPVKAIYEWQYNLDGGDAWISLSPTLVAKLVVTGMALVKTYFHKRVTTVKGGTSEWSAVLSITVE